jgi:hypothetical protein
MSKPQRIGKPHHTGETDRPNAESVSYSTQPDTSTWVVTRVVPARLVEPSPEPPAPVFGVGEAVDFRPGRIDDLSAQEFFSVSPDDPTWCD